MRDRDLNAAVLGLTAPWNVVGVELDTAAGPVRVHVATAKGTEIGCPTCVAPCPRHDHRTREWRHLDTCQFPTILVADTSLTGAKHILLKRGNTLGSVGKFVVDVLRELGLRTARAWAIK